MSMINQVSQKGQRTIRIVGTAMLGALVIILDYTFKFSGWKIPLPWFPTLRFDFTGIPIALSLLMYGLPSGAATSSIAFLAILLRSSDPISASMKALAEFSTILGMAISTNRANRTGKYLSIASGLIFRVVTMSLLILALPSIAYLPSFVAAVLFLPILGIFNIIAGAISIFGSLTVHEAIKKRIPSLNKTK